MTNPDKTNDVPSEQPSAAAEGEKTASPHDALFYKTFSNPEHAAAELKHVLPAEMAARIDWNLHLESHRFVDPNLDNFAADILFSTKISGTKTYIHFLFEHASGPKTLELLQVLRYSVRIWERVADEPAKPGTERQLPPIVTIILHHSEKGWRGHLRFRDYYQLDAELSRIFAPYLLDFGVIVDDISKVDSTALVARAMPPEVQLVLFALRYGRTGRQMLVELPKMGPIFVAILARENGRLVLAMLIVYMKAVAKVSETEIRMALLQTLGNSLADEIAFAGERKYEAGRLDGLREGQREGLRKGKREGQREGKREGQRLLLERLLNQRFGTLPSEAITRLRAATSSDLEAIGLRIFTAATLDEALGKPLADKG